MNCSSKIMADIIKFHKRKHIEYNTPSSVLIFPSPLFWWPFRPNKENEKSNQKEKELGTKAYNNRMFKSTETLIFSKSRIGLKP